MAVTMAATLYSEGHRCCRLPKHSAAPDVQTPAQMGELHQALLSLDPGAFLTHRTGALHQGMEVMLLRSVHNVTVLQQVNPYSSLSQV